MKKKLPFRSHSTALFFIFWLSSNFSYSQMGEFIRKYYPPVTATSPTASSLGKYGDIPVSYFTGVPDITIPLFEVKSGNLKIPINLSYHASGIKIYDRTSGWCGPGWSISTGPTLSRTVMGIRDEDTYFSKMIPDYNGLSFCNHIAYFESIAAGNSDSNGDIFNYSLLNGGGKFVLDQDLRRKQHHFSPSANVKVDIEGPQQNAYSPFNRFILTDENGIKYSFGKDSKGGNAAYEITKTTTGYSSATYTSSWMITEIISGSSSDTIKYTYQDGQKAYLGHNIDNISIAQPSNGHISINPTNISNGAEVTQKFISTIAFENGIITFKLSDAGLLDRIDVFSILNNSTTLVKTIFFSYDYFKNAGGSNLMLKLNGIKLNDSKYSTVQSYKFEYTTDNLGWRSGKAVDYWGFYNGNDGNENLILRQPVFIDKSEPYTIGGAYSRDTNPNLITQGVLKKIHYPTGGYTEFEFEAHKYLDTRDGEKYAGGLRVTKISSYDDISAVPRVITYKYGENESGYGEANFFSNGQYSYEHLNEDRVGTNQVLTRIFTSKSPFDMTGGGTVVFYPYVTEYFGDVTNHNGKITYIYDEGASRRDGFTISPRTTLVSKLDAGWERGHLTEKTIYDKYNNPISKTVNTYTNYNTASKYLGFSIYNSLTPVHSISNGSIYAAQPCASNSNRDYREYLFQPNFLLSGIRKLKTSTEYLYSETDRQLTFSKSSSYNYSDKHLQVIETTVTTENTGEELVTKMTYPLDYTVPTVSSGSAKGIQALQGKNIITPVVESYTLRRTTAGSRVIAGTLKTFKTVASPAYPLPDSVFLLEVATPLTTFTPSSINRWNNGMEKNPNYKNRVRFIRYSNRGQILEVAQNQQGKDFSNTKISYQWGYNQTLPIAEVTNASSSLISYCNFETDNLEDFGLWAKGVNTSGIIKSDAKTGIRSYTGNLTIASAIAGNYVIQLWAKSNSTATANTVIVSGSAKPLTSNWELYEWNVNLASAGSITITSNGNIIDDVRLFPKGALMTTYTYYPLIGIRTVSDPNNFISTYEYDSFGRLMNIKDHNNNIIKNYQYSYKIK